MDWLDLLRYRRRIRAMGPTELASEIHLRVAKGRKHLETVPQSKEVYELFRELEYMEAIADDLRLLKR